MCHAAHCLPQGTLPSLPQASQTHRKWAGAVCSAVLSQVQGKGWDSHFHTGSKPSRPGEPLRHREQVLRWPCSSTQSHVELRAPRPRAVALESLL